MNLKTAVFNSMYLMRSDSRERPDTTKIAISLRFKINLQSGKTPRNRFILNLTIFSNQSRHKSLISLI